ncbi:hypothetical protein D770_04185 [Flammeovirgaceae bacterium 311]|nr:hypothetical protein D770_04150 [Flammeovirgaceae bacterium 311]AHM59104.1 hypothetical protein D770_04185 [Flammeovirgaceae bacterium 311]
MYNNRIKQAPSCHSAIDNEGSQFCELYVKAGEGRLLYSMDVVRYNNPMIKKLPLLIFILTIFSLTSMAQGQSEFAVGDCLTFKTTAGDYYGFVVVETGKKKNDARIGVTPVIIKSKNEPTGADFKNGKVFINEVPNGSTNKNEEGFFAFHLF